MHNAQSVTGSQELAPGIMLFDNVFLNAMDYIKDIENKIEWRKAEVLVDQNENVSGTNYSARNTDIILLPSCLDNGDSILNSFSKDFYKNIASAIETYSSYYNASIDSSESPQLLRYGFGQNFHDHVDDHPFFTRRISLTFYLNDDYEGGEIEFKRFNLKVKAKKNQLLIFPSNFIYNHQVHPVIDGVRYVVVQWMA